MNAGTESHLLHVVMNGRVIGDIQRTGRNLRLRYDVATTDKFTPLSTCMPGPTGRYRTAVLAPWLDGLLPDRPETVLQWRRQFGVGHEVGPFSLLQHVGEDVAGAAQFVRPNRLEYVLSRPSHLVPLNAEVVAEMLRRAKAFLPISATDTDGKFSLAGAQAKIALHRTSQGWSDPSGSVPSTHIVKPAIPGMADQDLVEAVTLRAAAGLGLLVPDCAVEEFADERGLVVTRYDRTESFGVWRRVHQEDMCQALGLWPTRKYESQGGPGAVAIADLLRRTSKAADEDVHRFIQALVFNWLACGTDAHARNYALLLDHDSVRLAPLYDLNSHLAYSDGRANNLSMQVNGKFQAAAVSVDDWVDYAPTLRVGRDWIREEIRRQADQLVAEMSSAAQREDIARYDSPAITRLITNSERWVQQLTRG